MLNAWEEKYLGERCEVIWTFSSWKSSKMIRGVSIPSWPVVAYKFEDGKISNSRVGERDPLSNTLLRSSNLHNLCDSIILMVFTIFFRSVATIIVSEP